MEEDSLHFWIMPIICLVGGMIIFASVITYNITIAGPNAIAELEEIKTMSCDEIMEKNVANRYWSDFNKEVGNTKYQGCKAVEAAIKKAEKDAQDALLADPNSFESLSRDLEKYQELYDSYQKEYSFHASEASILKQNVTDFENKLDEIKSKLQQNYGQ